MCVGLSNDKAWGRRRGGAADANAAQVIGGNFWGRRICVMPLFGLILLFVAIIDSAYIWGGISCNLVSLADK